MFSFWLLKTNNSNAKSAYSTICVTTLRFQQNRNRT